MVLYLKISVLIWKFKFLKVASVKKFIRKIAFTSFWNEKLFFFYFYFAHIYLVAFYTNIYKYFIFSLSLYSRSGTE